MKQWQKCLATIVLGSFGVMRCVNAQDSTTTTVQSNTTVEPNPAEASPLYRAQELSLDFFGSGSLGEQTIDHLTGNRVEHNVRLGAGAGVNYFFCRYIGIGGDAYTENAGHNFIDSASGNLIGRLPIGDTGIAPYVFGGAGHQFDEVEQTFGQAGGGIELRFTHNVGLFVDARYVFPDRTENYGLGRAGLRLSF